MIEWKEANTFPMILKGTRNGILIYHIATLRLPSSDDPVYELTSTLPGLVPWREFTLEKLKKIAEDQFRIWIDRFGFQVRPEVRIDVSGLPNPARLATAMENEHGKES